MAALTVSPTPQLVPSGGTRDIRSVSANTATIYLGSDNTVSASTGYPLLPGEAFSVHVLDSYPDLYVVVASGTADLRYLV